MDAKLKILLASKVKCKKCGDVIESRTVHDFNTCKCGKTFIDGGFDYQRLGGEPEDVSEYAELTGWNILQRLMNADYYLLDKGTLGLDPDKLHETLRGAVTLIEKLREKE